MEQAPHNNYQMRRNKHIYKYWSLLMHMIEITLNGVWMEEGSTLIKLYTKV